MAYCPNCGTEYEAVPLRCNCGYLFGATAGLPTPAEEVPGRFAFYGDGLELGLLYFKLILFSIFTLGIYSFWGRTKIRQYLWSRIHFAGQPFDYHGTGKEIFLGWLKLIALLVVVIGGLVSVELLYPKFGIGVFGAVLIGGLILPLAVHGEIRDRWSRTSWQGRRFVYRGDLVKMIGIVLPGLFLSVITLSIYLPFFLVNLRRYVVGNTWYGGQQFHYEGEGRDLLWPYVKMLLLWIPTLTLCRFWFQARMGNYNWQKTQFSSVPFRSTLTGQGLLWNSLRNWLLTVMTLGIAYPWAVCLKLSYLLENLELKQLPRIQLGADVPGEANAFGDVLGESLGTDAGIDAGFGL